MIILNLSREHDFMAKDALLENKLIKTKNNENTTDYLIAALKLSSESSHYL